MYKVLVDDKVICDSRIDELAIIDPVIELEVNTVEQFSFTLPSTHPRQDLIKIRTSIITVYRDDELLFRGIAVSESVDFYRQKTYECEGILTFLSDSIQRPAHYSGLTVLELLKSYIASHNQQVEDWKKFEIGNVTVTDPNNYISCYTNYNDTMTEIKEDLVDDLGGFLRTRYELGKNYIDYLVESPHDATQVIELGKNLLDYKSNLSTMTIATRVIPLGAQLEEQVIEGLNTRLTIESVNGGIDYIESSLVDTYGIISAAVIFDNVTTAGALMTKGAKYMSDIQFENVTIEATAIDFGYLSPNIQKFKLLDKVHIISSAHGMDRWFLLSEMTLNLNNPENDRFKFGMDGIKSLTAQTKTANDSLLKAIEKITPESDLLRMAKEQATALICGTDGGYVVLNVNDDGIPYEILVMDKPTKEQATKVWRWNQNGLGYSSTGYNGEYGLAMTMDGKIVADYIASGTMYADRIKGGSLTLGGASNANGAAYVKDANGNVLVTLDKDGITLADSVRLLASNIYGGILKLGGHNNAHGKLNMLDESGNVHSKWDSEGINFGDLCIINENGVYQKSADFVQEKYKSVSYIAPTLFPHENMSSTDVNLEGDEILYNFPSDKTSGNIIKIYFTDFAPNVQFDVEVEINRNIAVCTFNTNDLQPISANVSAIAKNEYNYKGDAWLYSVEIDIDSLLTLNTNSMNKITIQCEYGKFPNLYRVSLENNGSEVWYATGLLESRATGFVVNTIENVIWSDNIKIDRTGAKIYDDGSICGVIYNDVTDADTKKSQLKPIEKFKLSNEGFKHSELYSNSVSGKALYINSNGEIGISSSARRFKKDISYKILDFDVDKLYELPVAQYRYNAEHWNGKEDSPLQLGLIAEDVADIFPSAAVFDDDGNARTWEARDMIPAMLKLIQDQNERLKILEEVLLDGRH